MSIAPTKSTRKKQAAAEAEDVLDALMAVLIQLHPEIENYAVEARRQCRAMFGGERHYIRKVDSSEKVTAAEVLAIFNGRNATEVARRLGISRAAVYRLKQPGRG